MPTTVEALAIAVLFFAPGLLYELGVSVAAGYQRPESLQKLWRAFAYSLIAQAVLFPVALWFWRRYQTVELGTATWSELWPLLATEAAYVAGPFAFGWVIGRRQRRRNAGVPSAWDHLFSERDRAGYVRARLKDGSWVGGIFGIVHDGVAVAPYATGYPDPPSLFLPVQLALDSASGELALDDDGIPAVRDWALLLHGDEIDLLEFQEFESPEETAHG